MNLVLADRVTAARQSIEAAFDRAEAAEKTR
jgi:hypothetical protein